MIGTRRIVIATVVLVVAGAVVAMMMLTSAPRSSAMAGSSPSPTMASDMPGMDHGSADTHGSSPSPTSSGDSPWKTHDDSETGAHSHGGTPAKAPDRPLAPVLGVFGGASAAVMLSAAFLGRKDRAISLAKAAARAAGKAAR